MEWDQALQLVLAFSFVHIRSCVEFSFSDYLEISHVGFSKIHLPQLQLRVQGRVLAGAVETEGAEIVFHSDISFV